MFYIYYAFLALSGGLFSRLFRYNECGEGGVEMDAKTNNKYGNWPIALSVIAIIISLFALEISYREFQYKHERVADIAITSIRSENQTAETQDKVRIIINNLGERKILVVEFGLEMMYDPSLLGVRVKMPPIFFSVLKVLTEEAMTSKYILLQSFEDPLAVIDKDNYKSWIASKDKIKDGVLKSVSDLAEKYDKPLKKIRQKKLYFRAYCVSSLGEVFYSKYYRYEDYMKDPYNFF
jgi:hypothetical protein